MYTEPQLVTVNAVAYNTVRVESSGRVGVFEKTISPGLTVQLRISHILGKRNRRTVKTTFTKTAADPLLDGVSRVYSMSVSSTIDAPDVGFSITEIEQNAQAHVDWMDTAGKLTQLVAGES